MEFDLALRKKLSPCAKVSTGHLRLEDQTTL
jgi:hypothetical protein